MTTDGCIVYVPGAVAAAFAAAAVVGPTEGRGGLVALAAAALAGILLLQAAWLHRARAATRWRATLDAYAAREIAGMGRDAAAP